MARMKNLLWVTEGPFETKRVNNVFPICNRSFYDGNYRGINILRVTKKIVRYEG